MPADFLAMHFHQPVQFIEIIGVPTFRHEPHEHPEDFLVTGIFRYQAKPDSQPPDVRIDDKDTLAKDAPFYSRNAPRK